jgi:iron complex outermembrane receptor protein
MTQTRITVLASAAASALGSGLTAVSANAQQAGLEEIVVTATRREQNLQDVPLAVMAFTGDSLEQRGVVNMEDLSAIAPNVLVAGDLISNQNGSFVIRGIPNVGLYIDGIWQNPGFLGASGPLQREMVDIERIEVLRGPQGTLYGRDSSGGAIRVYTQRPGDEFGVQAKLSLGSFDRRDVSASIDLPITDNLKTRWTLGNFDVEGYVTSRTTGFETGGLEDEALRADIVWTPTDRVSLRLIAQDDEVVTTTPRVQTWIEPQVAYNLGFQMGLAEAYDIASGGLWNCRTACAGYPGGVVGEFESTSEITVPNRQWTEQQSLDLQVQLTDSADFQYLFGHTFLDSRIYNDWDAGPFNFFIDYFNVEQDLTSHEFQFSGGGDRLSWVGGAYYWETDSRNRNPSYSMREWIEIPGYGEPQPYSYINQVLPHPSCQATPADRGVDFSFIPGHPANSVAGWIVPCDATLSPWPNTGFVGALGAGARPPAGDRLIGSQTDGYAVFGELTIGFTDRFDLTLGYRHHDQTEDEFAFDIVNGVSAAKPSRTNEEWRSDNVYDGVRQARTDSISFDFDKIRVAGSWRLSDDMMFYVGYTEGFNAGGIDTYYDSLGQVTRTYQPEEIENYEVGIRSDFANGRLRFNATAFKTEWKDIQLLLTIPDRQTGLDLTELFNQNAASADVDGLEIELNFAATDNILLTSNIGLLDTGYTETSHPKVTPGTEFAQAPDYTLSLGFQHDASLSNGGMFTTRLDATYLDSYWRSETPDLRQVWYIPGRPMDAGDFWLLNARLSFQPPNGNYQLSLFGTNLLDEYNINSGFMHGIWQFDFGTVDRPREVGLTMQMFFQ